MDLFFFISDEIETEFPQNEKAPRLRPQPLPLPPFDLIKGCSIFKSSCQTPSLRLSKVFLVFRFGPQSKQRLDSYPTIPPHAGMAWRGLESFLPPPSLGANCLDHSFHVMMKPQQTRKPNTPTLITYCISKFQRICSFQWVNFTYPVMPDVDRNELITIILSLRQFQSWL